MEAKQWLDEAEDKYSKGDFEGARHAYQMALSTGDLDLEALLHAVSDIRLTENAERRRFLRELRQKNPDSLSVWQFEAFELKGYSEQQRRVYSEIFERFGSDPAAVSRIRLNRLNHVCESHTTEDYALILEDFLILWDYFESYKEGRKDKTRSILLRPLLKNFQQESDIALFERLLKDQRFPAAVRAVFEVKILEIRTLMAALQDGAASTETPTETAPFTGQEDT